MFESLPRKDQRARGQCYLRGLMLDGRRKSIEPMAQRLGEVHHRPKWQLVLACWMSWLAAFPAGAAGRLRLPGHRQGSRRVDARQVPDVVQAKADTSAYLEHVHPTTAPYAGKGRPPRPRYHDKPCSLKELAVAAGQPACVDFELASQQGPAALPLCGAADAARWRHPRRLARQDGGQLPVRWLLVEWPTDQAEPVAYWLSNLPEAIPMVELVGLVRWRWRVEQDSASSRARLDWITSRGAAGWAGITTSRWSWSPTASSPWRGCAARNGWHRPDLVAAARPAARLARLLGPRLSPLPTPRTWLALSTWTITRTNLTES